MMAQPSSLPKVDEGSLLGIDNVELYYALIPHYHLLKISKVENKPTRTIEIIGRINTALQSKYTPEIIYALYKLQVLWKTRLHSLIGGNKQALFNTVEILVQLDILVRAEKDEGEAEVSLRIAQSDMNTGGSFNENRVGEVYKLNPHLMCFFEPYVRDTENDFESAAKRRIDYAASKRYAVKKQIGKELPRCKNCSTSNPKTLDTKRMLCLDCMLAGAQ